VIAHGQTTGALPGMPLRARGAARNWRRERVEPVAPTQADSTRRSVVGARSAVRTQPPGSAPVLARSLNCARPGQLRRSARQVSSTVSSKTCSSASPMRRRPRVSRTACWRSVDAGMHDPKVLVSSLQRTQSRK